MVEHQHELYILNIKPKSVVHSSISIGNKSSQCLIASLNKLSVSLIHERFGHLSISKLKHLSSCKDMDFFLFLV